MSVDVAMSPWHFPDVRFFEAKETDSNFPLNPLVTFSIYICSSIFCGTWLAPNLSDLEFDVVRLKRTKHQMKLL